MYPPVLLMIVGPTAVGKTELSIQLAQHFRTEIVSADARQCYQEMNVGTAKPTPDEQRAVKHHLVDFLPVTQSYDVKQYEQDALRIIAHLHRHQPVVVATGGSGLYVQTLCHGIDEMPAVADAVRVNLRQRWEQNGLPPLLGELRQVDPDYYHEVDQHNHRRVLRALEVYHSTGLPYSAYRRRAAGVVRPFTPIVVGLHRPRPVLYDRINKRVDQMMKQGLVEEARLLYTYRDYQALRTVGYQELFPALEGQYDLDEAVRLIKRNTRRYAKRQLTWFRRDTSVRWFDLEEGNEAIQQKIIAHVKDQTQDRLPSV